MMSMLLPRWISNPWHSTSHISIVYPAKLNKEHRLQESQVSASTSLSIELCRRIFLLCRTTEFCVFFRRYKQWQNFQISPPRPRDSSFMLKLYVNNLMRVIFEFNLCRSIKRFSSLSSWWDFHHQQHFTLHKSFFFVFDVGRFWNFGRWSWKVVIWIRSWILLRFNAHLSHMYEVSSIIVVSEIWTTRKVSNF